MNRLKWTLGFLACVAVFGFALGWWTFAATYSNSAATTVMVLVWVVGLIAYVWGKGWKEESNEQTPN